MDPTRRLAFLLFLVFFLPLSAEAGVDLFSATVPVADDTPAARREAMAEALRQVLVKVSGRRLKGKGEKLQALLEGAEDQAQEFRYRTLPGAEGKEPGRALWVRFDRRTVEEDLAALGLVAWESGRPDLVPWLAIQERGRRRLADPEKDAELFSLMRKAAERRGLVLVVPLMDLQDRNALAPADLWLVDRERIGAASRRYGRAIPLVGRLQRTRRGWKAEWILLFDGSERRFESAGPKLEQVVSGGMDQVADELVQRFLPASAGSGQDVVEVSVVGVRDLSGYAFLHRLLHSLDVVGSVELLRAEGDRLLFLVRALGGREALSRQLAPAPRLEPVIGIPDEGEAEGVERLSYALR